MKVTSILPIYPAKNPPQRRAFISMEEGGYRVRDAKTDTWSGLMTAIQAQELAAQLNKEGF